MYPKFYQTKLQSKCILSSCCLKKNESMHACHCTCITATQEFLTQKASTAFDGLNRSQLIFPVSNPAMESGSWLTVCLQ